MDSSLNKSASYSEIDLISREDKTPPNYVAYRNKRARETEFNIDLDSFKLEIKSMITSLFATQTKEIQKIIATQKEIQQTNINIENSIAYLTDQNEEFKKKIELLEGKIKDDQRYISTLEDRIEDLQRGMRKCNFEIKNVPSQSNETKEDLTEMVLCLARNVGYNIEKTDIKDIYRVRVKKEKTKNSSIVVETSSTTLKTGILKMCKAYNIKHKSKLCAKHLGIRTAEDTPIYISEQLTPRGARLYFLARDIAKSKTYRFCWTAYGKVYLRKDENSPIININSETQAHQLLQK